MHATARLALVALSTCAALACSAAPGPGPDEGAFERAVERCAAGDDEGALAALRLALGGQPDACQRALLEPTFARSGLRDLAAFRKVLEEGVIAQRVSRLVLAPADEPGEWIEVSGRLVNSAGEPVAGGVVSVFATDSEGRYHPTIAGERVPRLFATLVSDDAGWFEFRTVRPGPYPGTRNARHVHVSARAGDLRMAAPGYAVFDDDPLLMEPQNAEQRGEAVRIEVRAGAGFAGAAHGTLTLTMR